MGSYCSVWDLPKGDDQREEWVVLHQLGLPLALHQAVVLLQCLHRLAHLHHVEWKGRNAHRQSNKLVIFKASL